MDKTLKRAQTLYKISSSITGARQNYVVKLYKSVVRPILDYGCSIYADASKTNLAKLDSLQHRILCRALGVSRLSHKTNVNVEANTSPLHIRRYVFILTHKTIIRNSNIVTAQKRRNTLTSRRYKILSKIKRKELSNSNISTQDSKIMCKHA